MVDRGLLLPTVTKLSAGSNGRVACSGKRVNPKHGGLCLLEYDTKSDFLHMDAQKDAQAIYKVLKIKGYISPMLHLIPETESENNLVRFLLCIDFQYPRALRHCSLTSSAAALPGAKRPKKAKSILVAV